MSKKEDFEPFDLKEWEKNGEAIKHAFEEEARIKQIRMEIKARAYETIAEILNRPIGFMPEDTNENSIYEVFGVIHVINNILGGTEKVGETNNERKE